MRPHILVADDNPGIRELLTQTLSLDYRLTTVSDGSEVLPKLQTDPCDLLIIDLWMPESDGWETLQTLRSNSGWPDLKVIMLTVQKEPEQVLKAQVLGVSYYITKPFDIIDLLDAVKRCLS